MKLGQILMRKGHISPAELEEVLEMQSQKMQSLGSLLIGQGHITTDQLATALQEQYWRTHGYWVIDQPSFNPTIRG